MDIEALKHLATEAKARAERFQESRKQLMRQAANGQKHVTSCRGEYGGVEFLNDAATDVPALADAVLALCEGLEHINTRLDDLLLAAETTRQSAQAVVRTFGSTHDHRSLDV